MNLNDIKAGERYQHYIAALSRLIEVENEIGQQRTALQNADEVRFSLTNERDQLQAELAAIRAHEWQPIETAPKETTVLLRNVDRYRANELLGCFKDIGYWTEINSAQKYWCTQGESRSQIWSAFTEWAPLPDSVEADEPSPSPPPKQEQQTCEK